MKTNLFLCAIILIAMSFNAFPQQSSGTIEGKIRMETPKTEKNDIAIKLIETTAKSLLQTVNITNDGAFIFHNVPFATYDLVVENARELYAVKRIVVSSSVPVYVIIDSVKQLQSETVFVTGSVTSFDQSKAASHTVFTQEKIDEIPSVSSTKKIENIILSSPGAVPDEDGRMHLRGEDAQIQYVIDGIPVTGNLTRVYSSLLNAGMIKSVDIQTGSFGAEYGVANAAILSVTTKSGFDKPLFGSLHSGIGRFNEQEKGLEIGGMLGKNAAVYGNINNSSSNRYLDPIMSSLPNHSFGKNTSAFAKADFILSPDIDLHILGNFNTTEFEIPNSKINSSQDQRQNMKDYLAGLRLNYNLNASSVLSFLGYRRYAKVDFTSSGLSKLVTADDFLKAKDNEKMFIGAERTNESNGFQIEFASNYNWFNMPNVFKAAISGEVYPLKEFFTFAVTNPDLSDTSKAGGDLRYKPYDITQGGSPFLVNQSKTGSRFSAYLQDQFQYNEKWSFNAGLRFDRYSLFTNEMDVSPRLAASYALTDNVVIRASYNRIFMQAPVENLIVSSSQEALTLTGKEQGSTSNIVNSERSHVFEIGGAYKLNELLDFELVGYSKFINNFIVKVELGNSGIIFPVNLKNGLVAGGELIARLHNWNNISGSLSFSTCASLGLKPEDGSSPIGAGLILGEEGSNYSHPFAGEDMFKTEHNQLMTAVLNVNYHHPAGLFASLNCRFDSGLPFDLADRNGVGLDEAASKTELKARGYSDDIISMLSLSSEEPGSPDKSLAPRVIFDLGAGYNFREVLHFPLEISANILNVLDTPFLYKFESSFGGTHYGYPRMISLKAELGLN